MCPRRGGKSRGAWTVLKMELRVMSKSGGFWLLAVFFLGQAGMGAWGFGREAITSILYQPDLSRFQLITTVSRTLGAGLCIFSIGVMAIMNIVIGQVSIAIEKETGILESLMATPLRLRHIWRGKALALFLPSFAAGSLSALGILLWVNLAIIIPRTSRFILPPNFSLLVVFLLIPIAVLLLDEIYTSLQFILGNIRVILGLFSAVILGTLFGGMKLIGSPYTASPKFLYANLLITAALGVVSLFLQHFLSTERVVLSTKG